MPKNVRTVRMSFFPSYTFIKATNTAERQGCVGMFVDQRLGCFFYCKGEKSRVKIAGEFPALQMQSKRKHADVSDQQVVSVFWNVQLK
jgi:hypothetical protein